MKAAAIIPVYNEGERVLPVIEATKACEDIGQTIVVNDGSTDDTANILIGVPGVTVCTHERNQGKGEALDTGMNYAREFGYTAAVFLDGDLKGLEPRHIDGLLEPIESNRACMSIGYIGLRRYVANTHILRQWGALSGQRALQTEVWDLLSVRDKHRFNIEAALNARLRHAKSRQSIARVMFDGVSHVSKPQKEGSLPKAVWSYAKTYGNAWTTYARVELEERTQA